MLFAASMMSLVSLILWATPASAQPCPRSIRNGPTIASAAQTLTGRLTYYDGIRQWFELKLNKRKCGSKSFQLVGSNGSWNALEELRGCKIRSIGSIDYAGTGYFSRDLYQDVAKVQANGLCAQQAPLRDYSHAKP